MGGDGVFLANVAWEWEGSWEIGVGEEASEAAGGGTRAAIPGAGGDGGLGGGEVGEDRAGQERELWQALAGLGGGDEGAGGAEHLLGGKGELLDRPAVEVEVAERARRDRQGGGQDQWFGPARVVDHDEAEGRAVAGALRHDEVVPPRGAHGRLAVLPGRVLLLIWGRRGDRPLPVGPCEGADQLAPPPPAATPGVDRRGSPAAGGVLGDPPDGPPSPRPLGPADLAAGVAPPHNPPRPGLP